MRIEEMGTYDDEEICPEEISEAATCAAEAAQEEAERAYEWQRDEEMIADWEALNENSN